MSIFHYDIAFLDINHHHSLSHMWVLKHLSLDFYH